MEIALGITTMIWMAKSLHHYNEKEKDIPNATVCALYAIFFLLLLGILKIWA